MTYYAHTLPDLGPDHWEPLEKHLQEVAELAAQFAKAFGAEEWGRLAGLWHDLGKYSEEFQRRILGEAIHVEHTGAGACLAVDVLQDVALAFVIAGHHAGMCNLRVKPEGEGGLTPLIQRRQRAKDSCQYCCEAVRGHSASALVIPLAPTGVVSPSHVRYQPVTKGARMAYMIWTRMLFSSLVDADSIATEAFCSPSAADKRKALLESYLPISQLQARLDSRLDALSSGSDGPVNVQRRRILGWCRERSSSAPGFFTLCVPTGGGKTLASMSFALRHAMANGMRRVVVAVPFCSIIEQNSGVYADFLGPENVIEHHSNLDDYRERAEGSEESETAARRRLACENWDAPIIVTTNVMLLESLFTNKRGRARKLHNLAGSVIILDEAQCVPGGFLEAILFTLRELVDHYGCSVVICTATQPAWRRRPGFEFGIPEAQVSPIIPLEVALLKEPALDRVDLEWPATDDATSEDELAAMVSAEASALVIVNRKKDAVSLAEKVQALCPGEAVYHLSTNMCAAHRKDTLATVKAALCSGKTIKIVSTNLIEAGVDIDLPVVYRAMAGLDAIAQAAGRCNREGKLTGKGRVVVYNAEKPPPDGILRKAADVTRSLIKEKSIPLSIKSPQDFDDFFTDLYGLSKLDGANVMTHVMELNFETVSRLVTLIDDGGQTPVVIPYDHEARRRLDHFRKRMEHADLAVAAMRALQPYTVNVRDYDLQKIKHALSPLEEGSEAYVLNASLYPNAYHPQFGLLFTDEALRASQEAFVC